MHFFFILNIETKIIKFKKNKKMWEKYLDILISNFMLSEFGLEYSLIFKFFYVKFIQGYLPYGWIWLCEKKSVKNI